eukprot:scaffold292645_cov38-Tisochrysis_lutea.AAC.2
MSCFVEAVHLCRALEVCCMNGDGLSCDTRKWIKTVQALAEAVESITALVANAPVSKDPRRYDNCRMARRLAVLPVRGATTTCHLALGSVLVLGHFYPSS